MSRCHVCGDHIRSFEDAHEVIVDETTSVEVHRECCPSCNETER